MKKTILAIAIILVSFAGAYANSNNPVKNPAAKEKAMKSFQTQFGTIADINIFDSEEGFIFKSNADGKLVTASFDKKGNWIYSIESFPAHQLLKDIIDVVSLDASNGYGTSIQKVTQPTAEPVFIIQTQGKDFIKTLRLSNNQLESVSDYKKG